MGGGWLEHALPLAHMLALPCHAVLVEKEMGFGTPGNMLPSHAFSVKKKLVLGPMLLHAVSVMKESGFRIHAATCILGLENQKTGKNWKAE